MLRGQDGKLVRLSEVANIGMAEVYRADEMFCTGTMGELAPVTEVDGRVIGDGGCGLMTERLSGLFGALTEREGFAIV